MSRADKIQENKAALLRYYAAGLNSNEAIDKFREEGGHWREQDFKAAYRMIRGTPKAGYNIGGAARAGVKEPKIEKYQKKAARKKAKKAALPAKGKKKARTPARKKKEAKKKAKRERAPEIGGVIRGQGYTIKAIDITISTLGRPVNYRELQDDLQAHGIRIWSEEGRETLHLARSGDTLHVYGMAIFEPGNDEGGQAFGTARALIDKIKRELGE